MKRKYIAVGVLVLLLAAGFWAYREYNRKRSDSLHLSAKFTVEASDLLQEFAQNEKQAGEKYAGLDIIVAVEGTVKEIIKHDNGAYTLLVGNPGDPSSVRCAMDTLYTSALSQVNRGQRIRIKGNFNGYKADDLGIGSDVEMNFCVLRLDSFGRQLCKTKKDALLHPF